MKRRMVCAVVGVATAVVAVATAGAQGTAIAATASRGDTAWDAGRFPDAKAAYDSVVRADSAVSSRAVYRLGTLRSWDSDFREAIALHRLYVRLEPRDVEGFVGLARVYSWALRFKESVAAYDTVLARAADHREAALGRAAVLSWWGKHDASVAAYAAWLETHPNDTDVELASARVLSWAGRLDESLAIYEKVASRTGATEEAEKGMARVLGWRGDLERSAERWRAVTAKHPNDPEAWAGLGQVLRWLGRPFAARDALQQALQVKPDYADARSQLRWVRSELEWGASLNIVSSMDSEKNGGTAVTLGADGPLGRRARATVRTASRSNTALGASGRSQTARVGGQWQTESGHTSLRADIGTAGVSNGRTGGILQRYSTLVGGARIRTRFATRVSAGVGLSRDPFDDVVSTMREQLSVTTYDADMTLSFPGQVTLSGVVAASRATGDTIASNGRMTFGGTAGWTARRGLTFALNVRSASWDHPEYGTYFAPQSMNFAHLSARWERTSELGLIASGEVAAGWQSTRFEQQPASARLTPRASVTFGWRAAPGREITLTGLFANVASAGTVAQSDYEYTAISLGGRFTR